MEKSVIQIIENVCEDICNNYCKYPDQWNPEDHAGQDLTESEICEKCPLNRLN